MAWRVNRSLKFGSAGWFPLMDKFSIEKHGGTLGGGTVLSPSSSPTRNRRLECFRGLSDASRVLQACPAQPAPGAMGGGPGTGTGTEDPSRCHGRGKPHPLSAGFPDVVRLGSSPHPLAAPLGPTSQDRLFGSPAPGQATLSEHRQPPGQASSASLSGSAGKVARKTASPRGRCGKRIGCSVGHRRSTAPLGTKKIIDQTERRVLRGETVPAAENLSWFEEHTDIIKKKRRETVLGTSCF